MKAAAWAAAVDRYLLPRLGPTWRRVGDLRVIRGAVDWTACSIGPEPSQYSEGFRISAYVKLLIDPEPSVLLAERLGRDAFWEPPRTEDGWADIMAEVEALIRAEAEPLFDRYGTLEGYLTFLGELQARLPRRHPIASEHEYYARLLLGDPAADAAGLTAERDAGPGESGWDEGDPEALARVRRVRTAARSGRDEAVAVLREYAAEARTGLEPP